MKSLGGIILIAAFSGAALAAGRQKAPAVLATVDGVAIKRSDALDRTWKQYGTAVLNDMVDDILVRESAKANKVKADETEVDARLKRMQSQFPDEETFKARLAATGTDLAELRARISEQVLRESLLVKLKGLQVTDAEARDFFAANKERLGSPESVHLRHIQVADEKEAGDFLLALKAGADFAKLAAQASKDLNTKDRGGDLGFIAKGMLLPEIEKAAFELKPGEIGGPVKTQFGFHILKVEEVRPPQAADFEKIKDDLRKALLNDKITKVWPDFLKELRAKAKIELNQQS